jgi:hypothetical protein
VKDPMYFLQLATILAKTKTESIRKLWQTSLSWALQCYRLDCGELNTKTALHTEFLRKMDLPDLEIIFAFGTHIRCRSDLAHVKLFCYFSRRKLGCTRRQGTQKNSVALSFNEQVSTYDTYIQNV